MKRFPLLQRFSMLLSYFSHSVLSTLLDVVLVWLLMNRAGVPLVAANTIGVVAGFLLGFLLDVKSTFRTAYSLLSFLVYFGTFLLGLALADGLIALAYRLTEDLFSPKVSFLLSKGVSIVLPFFALYFVRKRLYQMLQARKKKP